jgi:hypothetical protein
MSQAILITLTVAGGDTGPFDLYSNVDGYTLPFENNIAKLDLEAGYVSGSVPDGASTIRVRSDNVLCSNYVDLEIPTTTTTSTSTTSTSSTTTTSTSTTTTTTGAPTFYDHRRSNTPSAVECSVCPPSFGSGFFFTSPSDTIPTIGMVVYTSSALTTPFNGGDQWWGIEWDGPSASSVDHLKISSLGVVTDTGICAVDCP